MPGHKIFVSYKYHDDNVKPLNLYEKSTVRDYVTKFEKTLDATDNIYKGEHDNEDLSDLSDDQIWEKLKDKIYDSSVTVVFISPGMREENHRDRDQWIPWEISYSLKEVSRRDKRGNAVTSRSNAMIGVVLPDQQGLYSYYYESNDCCSRNCVTNHTEKLFKILRMNMFNYNYGETRRCDTVGEEIWFGEHSL